MAHGPLVDKVVVPVLLYGSEVWGYENLDVIERVHLKFLKHNLIKKLPRHRIRSMAKQVASLYIFQYTVE